MKDDIVKEMSRKTRGRRLKEAVTDMRTLDLFQTRPTYCSHNYWFHAL